MDLKLYNTEEELQTVSFHRNHILLKPEEKDLLTMDDADVCKLPALDFLLKTIFKFRKEMDSIGVKPKPSKVGAHYKNQYLLTDSRYKNFDKFFIKLESEHFDPDWTYAIHAGFDFFIYLVQDAYQGRGEIADWIRIRICHIETVPFSFGSNREHVRALIPFVEKNDCYFNSIPMQSEGTVSFNKMDSGLNFKTALFNQSVNDACIVMEKIIADKNFLEEYLE